jgi:hypothetical protein
LPDAKLHQNCKLSKYEIMKIIAPKKTARFYCFFGKIQLFLYKKFLPLQF